MPLAFVEKDTVLMLPPSRSPRIRGENLLVRIIAPPPEFGEGSLFFWNSLNLLDQFFLNSSHDAMLS